MAYSNSLNDVKHVAVKFVNIFQDESSSIQINKYKKVFKTYCKRKRYPISAEDIEKLAIFIASNKDFEENGDSSWMDAFHGIPFEDQYRMIKQAQNTYYQKRIKKSKPVVRKYTSGNFKISVHHTDNCFPNLDEVSYTLPYLRNHFPNDTCVVCLEKFKDGGFVRQLPCAHVFHHSCLDGWIENKTNCPTCRRVLVIKFKSSHQCFNWQDRKNRKNIEIHMLTKPKFD